MANGYYQKGGRRPRIVSRMAILAVIAMAVISALMVRGTLDSLGGKDKVQNNHASPPTFDNPDTSAMDAIYNMEAKNILSTMTDEEKVGTLLLIRSHGAGTDKFASLAAGCSAGGVVLYYDDVKGKSGDELTAAISKLQNACGGKLLVCVNEEGGDVVSVSKNPQLSLSPFASPQNIYSLYGMEGIESDAREKCDFLSQYGINVNFAPVADAVTSSAGFMFRRSFGRSGEETAQYVKTIVLAMTSQGMGCTLKHFPGYGNTVSASVSDSDGTTSVIDTTETVIRERDLPPFKAGIAAGADSVMITGSIVTALDGEHPACMSEKVISLLRGELGFGGVIISEEIDNETLKKYSDGRDVCVSAFMAGVDMLLCPADAKSSYNALLKAVKDGFISRERLDESVLRIIKWKLRLGLYAVEG